MSTLDRFYIWLDANKLKLLTTRYPNTTTPNTWAAWLSGDTGMVEGATGYGDTVSAAIEHLIKQLGGPLRISTMTRSVVEIPRFEAANA